MSSHSLVFVSRKKILETIPLRDGHQSRTSSLRSLLRMLAWRNERLSKDPFEGQFWLVAQKQCKW